MSRQESSSVRAAWAVAVLLPALAGCGGKATIRYAQVGNFGEWREGSATDPTATTTTAGQGIWMMYRILQVKNASNVDFPFDPANLYVVNHVSDHSKAPPQASNDKAQKEIVKAGKTRNELGCVILWIGSDKPASLKNSERDLKWRYGGEESPLVSPERDPNIALLYVQPMTDQDMGQMCK
jgi:hypothetical protein